MTAKDEIIELITFIMTINKCDLVRATEIVVKKYPDLYSRYTQEIMN